MIARSTVLRGVVLILLVAMATLLPMSFSDRSGSLDTAEAATSKRGHVYLFRGLANIFSLGMDELADKLSAKGIRESVINHSVWPKLADEIIVEYKSNKRLAPIVIVGHSLGGNAALLMAAKLGEAKVPVRLLVIFDATNARPVTANVREAINFYVPGRNTSRYGNSLKPGPGFKGRIQNEDLKAFPTLTHMNVDESAALHERVVKKVARIMR
jgi:pimeloyl-ACP methyl ester carboxylesterase